MPNHGVGAVSTLPCHEKAQLPLRTILEPAVLALQPAAFVLPIHACEVIDGSRIAQLPI
jgi:hypothetical protein